LVGGLLSPRLFRATLRLKGTGLLLSTALVLCFVFGFAALNVGLAPIVGAFAAGLVLEPVHYQNISPHAREHTVEELLAPITSFLVPVFFVLMGLRVDLSIFAHGNILLLSGALTAVAILGKQVCGLGVGKGINRVTIGLGMIPRGEVGLIFANMGLTITVKGEPVLSQECFSAIVIMVILTTLVTPPALRWSLSRSGKTARRALAA
jgi:Kef-type K+ transport system membrane component KefB